MAIICNTYLSTRNFQYVPESNCLVTEASDLNRLNHDSRVYDDACDVGFVMVSHKTGESVLFVNDGVDENDGDIAGWRYKAYRMLKQSKWVSLPAHLEGLNALVIND